MKLLRFVALAMLGFSFVGETFARPPEQGCPWKIVSTRPNGPRDVPFDEGVPLLAAPANPNNVPGPGTQRAVVRTDKSHHPFVYLEGGAQDSSRRLLEQWASQPRWSPDGKWIACEVYSSQKRGSNLGLVELATGKVLRPALRGRVESYSWSPDSRRLALELGDPMGGFTVLGFYSVAARSFDPVDTLRLFAEYEIAWSPDSQVLAVSKPSFIDKQNEGEVTQSDLWLMSDSRARCRLVEGRGFLATTPRWLGLTRVSYVREVWKHDEPSPPQGLVIEIMRR